MRYPDLKIHAYFAPRTPTPITRQTPTCSFCCTSCSVCIPSCCTIS